MSTARADGVHVTLTYDLHSPPECLTELGAALNDATTAIDGLREALFAYPLEVEVLTSAAAQLHDAACHKTGKALYELLHGPPPECHEDDELPF